MSEDWDRVTLLRKARPSAKDARSTSAINRAMATGNVEISKKTAAGGNKQSGPPALNLGKIEADSENFKVNTVEKDVSKAIIDGRQKKGINQKELATLINEKIQVIQEFEQGKALPNQQILSKLERALGVKLRGTGIGAPLTK